MLFKRISAILCVSLSLAACARQTEDFVLNISAEGATEMFFEKSGGSRKLSLTSSGEWSAYTRQENWIVLGLTKGPSSTKSQSLTIWVNPNTGAPRTGEIIFYNDQHQSSVQIKQDGVEGSDPDDPGGEGDPDGPGGGGSNPPDYFNAPELTIEQFLSASDPDTYFRLHGVVSSFNEISFEMNLTDASGAIYVYNVLNREEWAGRIYDNGTITLAGKYHFYPGKRIDEVVDAYILSFTPAGGASAPIPVTTSQFKAMPASEEQSYRLAGRMSNVTNTVYGNFDLVDETGSVYVYGLTATNRGYGTSNDKSFASLRLQEGDEIVIISFRADYNGQPEAKYSYFLEKTGSSQGGGGGEDDDHPDVSFDFRTKMDDLPQSSGDGLTDGTYICGGYPFTVHATNKFYQGQTSNVYHLLVGKQGSFIQFPVLAGKALKGIKFKTASQASENVIVDVANADGTRLMINDTKLKKNVEYSWYVPGVAGSAYELLITNSYNAQFQYIFLYYE